MPQDIDTSVWQRPSAISIPGTMPPQALGLQANLALLGPRMKNLGSFLHGTIELSDRVIFTLGSFSASPHS